MDSTVKDSKLIVESKVENKSDGTMESINSKEDQVAGDQGGSPIEKNP